MCLIMLPETFQLIAHLVGFLTGPGNRQQGQLFGVVPDIAHLEEAGDGEVQVKSCSKN